MKLRARLGLTLVLLVVPLAVGIALAQTHWQRRIVRESLAEAVIARMEAGGRERCEADPAHPGPGPRGRAHRPGPPGRGGRHGGRMSPPPGAIFAYDAALRPQGPTTPPLAEALRRALLAGETSALRRVRGPDGWMDEIAVRMPWDDGPCAVLVMQRPAPPAGETMRTLVPTLVVSLAAALIAVLAAGPLVSRIRELTEAVRRVREVDAPDIPVRGRDEIAELASAFNADRARIREQFEALEQRDAALTEYIAHTTHDVMLPLTVLQGHLIALRQGAERGTPADAAVLAAAIEESHYLASLVHNLNAAARLEAGILRADFVDVDLNALVERVVARHQPVAAHKSLSLEHAVPEEPTVVRGDLTLLERAVSNVVHNAVRYNLPGGHVAVVLDRRPKEGRFALRVVDDGPGVADEELVRITERSYRGNEARTRHPHGMGLGLHIARDVAARHGFTLAFRRPEEGGLEVALDGPLADAGAR